MIQIASVEGIIASKALGESRGHRVFNPDADGAIVYTLDGQSYRNGLVPATLLSMAAFLRMEKTPTIIAIYSGAKRDIDFRPRSVSPTYWRPNLAGRSPEFDSFLLTELIPEIESRRKSARKRYLMGHSLAGLYALDLATRSPGTFEGIFAFSPTFSHDVSITKRLPNACSASRVIYANWGLESGRDTSVFEGAAKAWRNASRCKINPPIIRRHYGMLHQLIMVTGQAEAAWMHIR